MCSKNQMSVLMEKLNTVSEGVTVLFSREKWFCNMTRKMQES